MQADECVCVCMCVISGAICKHDDWKCVSSHTWYVDCPYGVQETYCFGAVPVNSEVNGGQTLQSVL